MQQITILVAPITYQSRAVQLQYIEIPSVLSDTCLVIFRKPRRSESHQGISFARLLHISCRMCWLDLSLIHPALPDLNHIRPLFLHMLWLCRRTKAAGNMAGSMYFERADSMLHVGGGQ